MNRVILFSEMMSEKSRRAAVDFLKKGDIVYALGDSNATAPEGVTVLNIDRTDPNSIAQAVESIKEDKIDLLVLSNGVHGDADGTVREHHSMDAMVDVMDKNLLCNYFLVDAIIPRMQTGGMKRIAVLTETKASNNETNETTDFAYAMSAAATNMMQRLLFNKLRPEGFTFRNFADDGKLGGMCAADYFCCNLCDDPNDAYIHADENRLVMRNQFLKEIPW